MWVNLDAAHMQGEKRSKLKKTERMLPGA